MIRPISRLLPGAVLLLLVACATSMKPPPSARLSEDPALLGKIQAAMANQPPPTGHPDAEAAQVFMLETSPISQSQMASRLRSIVDRLLRNWTATPKPAVDIFIMPDSRYGGDAIGPNEIFINTGTLERAGSEDEVAFVLAHELAHILRGHYAERKAGIGVGDSMISYASQGAVLGVLLAHAGQTQLNHGATGAVLAAFQVGQILLAANDSVGDAGWSRDQEYEADALGLDLMIKSRYYNPAAYIDALDRLAIESQEIARRRAQLRGSVTQAVQLAIAWGVQRTTGNNAQMPTGQALEALAGMAAAPAVEGIVSLILPADTHPTEIDRRNRLQVYQSLCWAESDSIDQKPNPFTTPQAASVYASVKTSDDISQALTDHKFDEASKLAAQPQFGRVLSLRQAMVRGQIAFEENDSQRAQSEFQSVIRDSNAPANAYTMLATIQAAGGKTDAALAVLNRGQDRFRSEAGFLPYRIAILRQGGRSVDADAALKRCLAFGIPSLSESCKKAEQPDESVPNTASKSPG